MIDEGVKSLVAKGAVEVASETITSILSSEVEEHIIGESVGKCRRR